MQSKREETQICFRPAKSRETTEIQIETSQGKEEVRILDLEPK